MAMTFSCKSYSVSMKTIQSKGEAMKERLRALYTKILDMIGERDEIKNYLGHGDYSIERGWWIFGRWKTFEPDSNNNGMKTESMKSEPNSTK